MENLSPAVIVKELDKHIIGQNEAKKAVAIALRNRYRRQMVNEPLRHEITPKNILMIGPTGVGKTEIARRLAKLANAPFIKVEATKFTEVGYVGKEVDSIIRDLVDITFKNMRLTAAKKNMAKARLIAIEKILNILVPTVESSTNQESNSSLYETIKKMSSFAESITGKATGELLKGTNAFKHLIKDSPDDLDTDDKKSREQRRKVTHDHFRELLLSGKLDDKMIEIDVQPTKPRLEIISPSNLEDITSNIQDMLSGGSSGSKKRKVTTKEALEILTEEEAAKLVDEDEIKRESIKQVSQNGIVFIDEIDKVVSRGSSSNIDVSRSGVQRDLLPLVEGTMVNTRYGIVNTDHILFIASGAFHIAKPSDLLPELQGRFPVRVELQSLSIEDFERILTEPHACLTTQYKALLATENAKLTFTKDGVKKIAEIAFHINKKTENIGARRLYTVMERLLEDILFTPEEYAKTRIDSKFVNNKLEAIASSEDLSRYIL